MPTLLASSLTISNPYNIGSAPDLLTGWNKPAAAFAVQVLSAGGVQAFRRSSGSLNQMSTFLDNTTYSGNTLVAEFVHAASATQGSNASSRVCFANAANDGYLLWLDQAGTTAAIYKFTDYVMDASPIATFTSYGTGYSQTFQLRCIDKANGIFQFWRNGVQIGSNVVDTTHSNLIYIGLAVNGGNVLNITTGALYAVTSITDPIVMGGAITVSADGYSTVTSVSGGGMSATGVSYSAGTTTATWPAISESISPNIALPATDVTITVTDGSNPRTILADINLEDGWASVEFGTQIDEPGYLLAGVPIEPGFYGYYVTNQPGAGNVVIYPDGSVYTDADAGFSFYLNRLGDDDSTTLYNITAGSASSGGGLTSVGLTSVGLTSPGLTGVGL